jgi:hypothetical protein
MYSNDKFRKSGDEFMTGTIKTAPNMPNYDSAGAIYYIPNNTRNDNHLFYLNRYTTNNTDNILAITKL